MSCPETHINFKENPIQTGKLPLCLSVAPFVTMWKSPRYIYVKTQDIPCILATIIRQRVQLRINRPTRMIKKMG